MLTNELLKSLSSIRKWCMHLDSCHWLIPGLRTKPTHELNLGPWERLLILNLFFFGKNLLLATEYICSLQLQCWNFYQIQYLLKYLFYHTCFTIVCLHHLFTVQVFCWWRMAARWAPTLCYWKLWSSEHCFHTQGIWYNSCNFELWNSW